MPTTVQQAIEDVAFETNKKDAWRVVNGDCLDVMKKMPDMCVDYTFTSPPYNDSGKTERDIETNRHVKYKTVEYRSDWYEWQCECIEEMIRVSRNMVFYNVQAILSNKADVYRIIGRFADRIHMILIWYKPNAQPQAYDNRIGNNYEMVIIFKCNGFKCLHCNSKNYNTVIVQNINSDHRYSDVHKAVMSQRFADEIIGEFTQENEMVFDPFCGLGTTGIACINQQRRFFGCEIDSEYCDIARKRIEGDTAQYSIFDMN